MVSIYQAKDHRWRDGYNPLRGLGLPRLVSLLEAGERGQYADLQWFQKITLTATGGLLTMLSQAGSGTLAGNAHAETFQQIARSDAVVLSGVLQRGIDVPLLTEFFPGQPVQAYFEFAPGASAESARVVEDAVRLARAGYRMDAAVLAEKTGYAFAPEAGTGSDE
jgi:hypothetical protein